MLDLTFRIFAEQYDAHPIYTYLTHIRVKYGFIRENCGRDKEQLKIKQTKEVFDRYFLTRKNNT